MSDPAVFETYVQMFDAYLQDLGDQVPASAMPLVFHARKVCEQLDAALAGGGSPIAAKDTSYLQAVERLNKRLNPATPAGGVQLPGQTDIFGALED